VSIDEHPTCRAAIRDGTVTLNRWRCSMAACGPSKAGLSPVRGALADLYRQDDELVVAPVRDVPWGAAAEAALLAWAERVGYRRVWLPARVVDLSGALAPLGRAPSTCISSPLSSCSPERCTSTGTPSADAPRR